MHMPGQLVITVKAAKDLRDVELFGTQAPYVIVQVGEQEFRTRPHRGGGRNPEWDETFVQRISYEQTVEITIRDANSSHGKCIGVAKINLAKVRLDGRDSHHAPVHSPDSGHQHGHVHLALHFQPEAEAVQAPAVVPQQAAASPLAPAGYQSCHTSQRESTVPSAPPLPPTANLYPSGYAPPAPSTYPSAPASSAPAYPAAAYCTQPQAYACGAQLLAPVGHAPGPTYGIPVGYPAAPPMVLMAPAAAPDPYAAAAAALAEQERQELLREVREDRRERWEERREEREVWREEREVWREVDYGFGGPGLLFW